MNKKAERIFIWVIAIVMVIGTLGAYFIVIVANNNQANQQSEIAKLQQQFEEQQRKQAACQAAEISEGSVYTKPEPVQFEKDSVNELKIEDVKVGEGTEITSTDNCVTVHYLGNTSDGTVFDNSYDRSEPTAFVLGGVIQGWQEGLMGMKEGGIRKIFIPSDKAYGEQGSGASIGPNEPLFFYVELIDVS